MTIQIPKPQVKAGRPRSLRWLGGPMGISDEGRGRMRATEGKWTARTRLLRSLRPLDAFEQLREGDTESVAELGEVLQAGVPHATLDSADTGDVVESQGRLAVR